MGACTGSAPHPPDIGHGSAAVAGHGHNRFNVLVRQGCYAHGLLQSPRTAPLPVQKSIRSVEVLTGIATFQGLRKMPLEREHNRSEMYLSWLERAGAVSSSLSPSCVLEFSAAAIVSSCFCRAAACAAAARS